MGRIILPVLVLAAEAAAGCAGVDTKYLSVRSEPPGAHVLFLERGRWRGIGETPITDYPIDSSGKWRGYVILEEDGYVSQGIGIDTGKMHGYSEIRFNLEPDLGGPLTIGTVPDGAMIEVEKEIRNWDPEMQWFRRTGQVDWVLVGNGHIELPKSYFKGNRTGVERVRVSFPGYETREMEVRLGGEYNVELERKEESNE